MLFPKSAVFAKIQNGNFRTKAENYLVQFGESGLESKSYDFTWTPSTIPVATVIKIKKI